MKIITYLSAGAFVVLSACIMNKETANQQDKLYETKWSLKKIETATGTSDVSTKAFIKFNKEKNSAGGNGSCNSFGSTLSVQKNQISLSGIFSTKMYCEEVQKIENEFLSALGKINRYEISNNKLILFHDKNKLLEFSPDQSN